MNRLKTQSHTGERVRSCILNVLPGGQFDEGLRSIKEIAIRLGKETAKQINLPKRLVWRTVCPVCQVPGPRLELSLLKGEGDRSNAFLLYPESGRVVGAILFRCRSYHPVHILRSEILKSLNSDADEEVPSGFYTSSDLMTFFPRVFSTYQKTRQLCSEGLGPTPTRIGLRIYFSKQALIEFKERIEMNSQILAGLKPYDISCKSNTGSSQKQPNYLRGMQDD